MSKYRFVFWSCFSGNLLSLWSDKLSGDSTWQETIHFCNNAIWKHLRSIKYLNTWSTVVSRPTDCLHWVMPYWLDPVDCLPPPAFRLTIPNDNMHYIFGCEAKKSAKRADDSLKFFVLKHAWQGHRNYHNCADLNAHNLRIPRHWKTTIGTMYRFSAIFAISSCTKWAILF